MTFSDWLLDLLLIGLVLVQLRGRKLTLWMQLSPVAIVCWVGVQYLRDVPATGNDLLLIVPAILLGLALGVGAGLTTKVFRKDNGAIFARATAIAAVLWIVGVGLRLAFQLYTTHGGGPSLARFSFSHDLTLNAWAPAIILMAFAEVLARTAIVAWRGHVVRRTPVARQVQPA
jgi:hypothetical protein